MNFFSDYIKAFKAEWLKLRNSGMFWLVLIMAAFIPGIFTLAGLVTSESGIASGNTQNAWRSFVANCFTGFGIFFYPIFLTLLVIRLTQMEHRGGGWKLIEVQPISKLSLYLGKFSIAVTVALMCIVALILFSLLGGTIIMLAKPGSGFSRFSIPWEFISAFGLRLLVAGLGVLGIQYLFSVVISGFIWPFAIGLVGTITGTILFGFRKALWWPYIAPGLTVTNPEGSSAGNFLMYYEWLSLAWMIIALWLGYQWYERKNLKRAFFKPAPRLIYLLIPAALFAAFFVYINKPVQLPSHKRTVIAGSLESKDQFKTAYLLADPLMDTILEIPIVNDRFRVSTDKVIPAGVYSFKLGSINQKVFFGNNDSLFLKIKNDDRGSRVTTSGNRTAENEYLRTGRDGNDGGDIWHLENRGYEMTPNAYANAVVRLWKNNVDWLNNFKTADNLKPGEEFITLQKKLISLSYLRLLDNRYPQWFSIYHPTETLEYPKSVEAIRSAVSYNDSTLLSYSQYRDNIRDYIQQKHRLSPFNAAAYISKLCTVMPAGAVRDYLIYNKLKEVIGKTIDTTRREMLITEFVPKISQPKIQQQILAQHILLKSLSRGKPAPDLLTTALNKDTFSLKNFQGKYVLIDVWATWCQPCQVQAPNFDGLAEQYSSQNVAFVALSIDDNKWGWQYEAGERSLRVIQLHANDKNSFSRLYGIDYIPRYILLGPDGKIINAQMPEPGNPLFEEILRREIPGLANLE
ncbi:MAG TPA: ABC transporter permease [Chitinophagaceae bacterium]|nr:ABC transporter permease [Chitinophagaceae bacterium]